MYKEKILTNHPKRGRNTLKFLREWILETDYNKYSNQMLSEDIFSNDYKIIVGAIFEFICNKFIINKRELCVLLLSPMLTTEEIGRVVGKAISDRGEDKAINPSITKSRVQQLLHRTLRYFASPRFNKEVFSPCVRIEQLTEDNKKLRMEIDRLNVIINGENASSNYGRVICTRSCLPPDQLSIEILDCCEFSVRSYNVLHRLGITTLGKLLDFGYYNLSRECNIGKKSLIEIQAEILNKFNVDFKNFQKIT